MQTSSNPGGQIGFVNFESVITVVATNPDFPGSFHVPLDAQTVAVMQIGPSK